LGQTPLSPPLLRCPFFHSKRHEVPREAPWKCKERRRDLSLSVVRPNTNKQLNATDHGCGLPPPLPPRHSPPLSLSLSLASPCDCQARGCPAAAPPLPAHTPLFSAPCPLPPPPAPPPLARCGNLARALQDYRGLRSMVQPLQQRSRNYIIIPPPLPWCSRSSAVYPPRTTLLPCRMRVLPPASCLVSRYGVQRKQFLLS
jgi:hypothetical protein